MDAISLDFKTIDLKLTRELCIRFRSDSFVVSFGDDTKFHEADGKGADRYIEWLEKKIARDPLAAVHVWQGLEIIGQLEFGSLLSEPTFGYVNLYYLIPERRGCGLSDYLEEYSSNYMKKRGFLRARLSVSPSNIRAMKFYEKHGWVDIGPRVGYPEVHFMEKRLT